MRECNSVGDTRKCVPIEAVRISSTSDSYISMAERYNSSKDPKFIFKCVNNGIPQRMCSAVDGAVLLFLRRIRFRKIEKQLGLQRHLGDCAVSQLHHNVDSYSNQVTACAVSTTWCSYAKGWHALATHTNQPVWEHGADVAYAHSARNSQWRQLAARVRSAMLDTGANASLFGKDVESAMHPSKPSRLQFVVANSEVMAGRRDGTLHMCILDSE